MKMNLNLSNINEANSLRLSYKAISGLKLTKSKFKIPSFYILILIIYIEDHLGKLSEMGEKDEKAENREFLTDCRKREK